MRLVKKYFRAAPRYLPEFFHEIPAKLRRAAQWGEDA